MRARRRGLVARKRLSIISSFLLLLIRLGFEARVRRGRPELKPGTDMMVEMMLPLAGRMHSAAR